MWREFDGNGECMTLVGREHDGEKDSKRGLRSSAFSFNGLRWPKMISPFPGPLHQRFACSLGVSVREELCSAALGHARTGNSRSKDRDSLILEFCTQRKGLDV